MISAILGSDNSPPSTTVTNFNFINSNHQSSYSSTISARSITLSTSLSLTDLYVEIGTAPGAGASYSFTVYKNGSPTALTVTISDSSLTASNTTDTVTFVAGDTIAMASIPTNNPASTTNTQWTIRNTASNYPVFAANSTGMPTTGSFHVTPLSSSTSAATYWINEVDGTLVVPTAGTFSLLRLNLSAQPGVGKSYTATLMLNGSPAALTAAIADTSTTATDSVNSVAVVAGDRISLQIAAAGTPTASSPSLCMVFTPTVDGEFFIGYGTSATSSTSVINYEQVIGIGGNSWSATESVRHNASLDRFTAKRLYVRSTNAPGGAATYTYALRSGGAGTALSAVISGTGTSANVSGNVNLNTWDKLTFSATPSGTPAAHGGVHIGLMLVATVAGPPGPPAIGGNFFVLG